MVLSPLPSVYMEQSLNVHCVETDTPGATLLGAVAAVEKARALTCGQWGRAVLYVDLKHKLIIYQGG